MSKRRKPGEVVRRCAGSGFVGSPAPALIRVPSGRAYEGACIKGSTGQWIQNLGGEAHPCILGCNDDKCREWANLEIVSDDSAGEMISHVAECEMEDAKQIV